MKAMSIHSRGSDSRNHAPTTMQTGVCTQVYVAFSVNLGLEDLASRLRVFDSLRGALRAWLEQHDEAITHVTHA